MLSTVMKSIVNDIDLGRLTQLVAEAGINPALGFEVTTAGRPVPRERVGRSARNGDVVLATI